VSPASGARGSCVMSELTVGFVGLGNMGWPMAANLHAAGFSLVVRDADAARQAGFAAEHPGALAAGSPDAFTAAGIVVTMLPNGAIVGDALLGWGIAAALRPGALVVEMSSSDPSDTVGLAAELERSGIRVVDAPVSGGVPRALTGELSLMVGGVDEDVARAQPVLRVLGDPARQFRTGGLGTGHAMKALNNVIGAATYCVTAEALVIGQRFGLDPQTMIAIRPGGPTAWTTSSRDRLGPREPTGPERPEASGTGQYDGKELLQVSCVTPGRRST
jgi:3-hydroxyisobutyrate dehydrogenase